jgi:hypothetical protein
MLKVLAITLLACGLALAAPAKTADKGSPGEAPKIELAAAVDKARAYATSHQLHVEKQYLQAAEFDPVAREWAVVWQLANAKGGRTEIHIPEGGAITVSYGD